MTLETVARYDTGRVTERPGTAVVVGAGVAGLCAARVLADAFERVVVLDADPLPTGDVHRRGVPQSRHLHQLLEAGRATIEDLFPGFGADLLAASAVEVDVSRHSQLHLEGGVLADGPRRRTIHSASRTLYEGTLRRQVAEVEAVEFRPRCRATSYRLDGESVTGVDVRPGDGPVEPIDADLVVDATGRASQTPAWLEANGFRAPPVDEVHIDLTYASVTVERDPADRRLVVVMPAPDRPRGGAAAPIEGDRWIVTLSGMHGVEPPTDPAGLRAYVADFPSPDLRRILAGDHLDDAAVRYPFPANRRHHYEALDRFPDGLVVVGDAVASFNPIYGQGMTVAALEALHLHHCLAEGGPTDLGCRFFDRAASTVDIAWQLSTMGDHQFPETTGPKPRSTGLLNWYVARLLRRARADGELFDAFFQVQMMVRPPTSLLRPSVVWRVLGPR